MPKVKFKRCILHIGGEKTGSTSLQLALAEAREELLEHGIYVPDRGVFRGNNWGFVAIAQHEPENSSLAARLKEGQSHADGIAQMQREYEHDFAKKAKGCDQLLVSSEHLQTQVNCQGIETLLAWIGGIADECLIVYAARRQDHALRSLYSTALRAAASTSFMFNPVNFQRAQSPRLNHWVAITRYLAYPARVPVTVRVVPYPEGSLKREAFWRNLTTALELPFNLTLANEANTALGLAPSRFLTTLFHPSMHPHLRFERPERLQLLAELGTLDGSGRVQPSKDWALDVLDGYKHSNRLLRETFLRDENEVFNLNVNTYPEQSSGVIGMTREEFFDFLDAAPSVASVVSEVGEVPTSAGFYEAIRERTRLS